MNAHVKKIVNQLTADKKKLSIMVGLLAVAMLMWGRLLLQKIPRTATAEPAMTMIAPATESVLGGVVIRPVVRIDPAPPLDRDLFALDPTGYLRVPTAPQDSVRVEKSDFATADDKLVAQGVAEAMRQLTLQSIVQGARPRAMINGQLVAAGQIVEGFTVSRIDQRYVMLTKDGVTVRLVME